MTIIGNSRRQILQALATAPVLAPFVPLGVARGQSGFPKRLCIVHTPNGLLRQELIPDAAGKFKRILEPLVKHQKDILVLDGLHMNSYFAQKIPNDHPPPLGHLLTGSDTVDPKDGKAPSQSTSWFASDVSIDQYVAARIQKTVALRFPALVLGVSVGGYGWHMSHTGFRKPVFPDNDDAAVFKRLMESGDGTGAGAAILQRRWAERKMARDVVGNELRALMPKLGQDDRQKLQAHLELLGDAEKREGMGSGGSATAKGTCRALQRQDSADPQAFVRSGQRQMENIAMAFACDLSRVALLQWDICASGRRFPWVGVDEAHHDLSHQQASGAAYEGLTKIGAFYASQVARFIDRLKSIPEGNGSVFDNTILVWTSEHSSVGGDHGRKNLPFILAGSGGGALKTGRVLKFDNAHNDLFVSLANAMGFADVTTFGRKDVCRGPLPGLLT